MRDSEFLHPKKQHHSRSEMHSCAFKILQCSSHQLCIFCFLLGYFAAGNCAHAANVTYPSQTTTEPKQKQAVQCFEDACYIKISSSREALENMATVSEHLFGAYAVTKGSQKLVNEAGMEEFINDVGLVRDDHEGHDHGHEGHDHEHHDDITAEDMADFYDYYSYEDEDGEEPHKNENGTKSRKRRSDDDEEFPCYPSVKELIRAYFRPQQSEDIRLTFGDFVALMPRLLLDLKRPECRYEEESEKDHDHETTKDGTGIEHSTANIWLISFGSVFVISLVSLLGVMVVPLLRHSNILNNVIAFLVALAVGSLVGDALLHLLPHASGAHDHDAHGHDAHNHDAHNHGTEPDEDDHFDSMWKGLVACGGIYVFFLLEAGMGYVRRKKSARKACMHGHSCEVESPMQTNSSSKDILKVTKDHRHVVQMDEDEDEEPLATDHLHHHAHKVPQTIASLAWMVIVGDGLHNVTDGLAIGAAFASSIGAGLSTVLAVFFHEIPQELGDFAILLNAGMTVKQALLWNFISACMCFVGLLIGLLVGEYTKGIILWILAFTAGGFLYIALVDMLPTMIGQLRGKQYARRFLLQNVGMLVGFALMVLIGLKEESLAHYFQ